MPLSAITSSLIAVTAAVLLPFLTFLTFLL
jgi:hypothetical protein